MRQRLFLVVLFFQKFGGGGSRDGRSGTVDGGGRKM